MVRLLRSYSLLVCLKICGITVFMCVTPSAYAIPEMFENFKAKYVAQDPQNDKQKGFASAVESTKCNVCHKGKKKSDRNRYGIELAKLVDKNELKANLKKDEAATKKELAAAFDKVAALPYESGNDDSPTFGQIIALGRLPGADHNVDELLVPSQSEKTPNEKPPTTVAAESSAGELMEALLGKIKADTSEELKAEIKGLTENVVASVMSQLKDELSVAVRAGIQAEREAEKRRLFYAHENEAVEKIREIGGTVREIAMNDDRKEVDFHLSGKSLTDDGLAQVKYIENLIDLHLKDTQITDGGLSHLKGMPSLTKLHLEETAITDDGLVYLKDIPNLEWLNIYGTQVTDAGIDHLKSLSKLKKLYIWKTKITIPGFQRLKRELPDTDIIPDLVKEKERAEKEAKRKAAEEKKKAEEAKKKKEEEDKKKAEEAKKKKEEEDKKKAEEAKKKEEGAKKKAEEEKGKAEEEGEEKEGKQGKDFETESKEDSDP